MTRVPQALIATLVALAAAMAALRSSAASPAPGEIRIGVPGIPGPYCMYGIEKRLAELPEVADVRLLWEEDEIRVTLRPGAAVSRERIEVAIERAEYPYPYSVEL